MSAGLPVPPTTRKLAAALHQRKGHRAHPVSFSIFPGKDLLRTDHFQYLVSPSRERCLLITPGTDRLFSSRDSSNGIPTSSTARPANADRLNTTTAGRHSWAGSFLPDWKQIPLRPLLTVPKRSERIQEEALSLTGNAQRPASGYSLHSAPK